MSGDCRDACKNLIIIHNCVTTCLMRCINHIYIVAKYKTLNKEQYYQPTV